MEKRSFRAKDKERQISEESRKTPFQKMLEERAKRLEEVCHVCRVQPAVPNITISPKTRFIKSNNIIPILFFRLRRDKMGLEVATQARIADTAVRSQ